MHPSLHRAVLGLWLAACAIGCKQRSEHEGRKPAVPHDDAATLPDLSETVDALRAEFNARRGKSRFLTLLSPT